MVDLTMTWIGMHQCSTICDGRSKYRFIINVVCLLVVTRTRLIENDDVEKPRVETQASYTYIIRNKS